jgi:phosphate transport system permease protein
MKDKIFKMLLLGSTPALLLLMAVILYSLISQAMPAFKHFGFFQFICSSEWNPGNEQYGALPFLSGTLLTALLASIISIPFSLSLALFIGDLYRGQKIASGLSLFVNILAGVPSIILGGWGYYSMRPLFASLSIGNQGYGILPAAILLSLMIIPYSASMTITFISSVPVKLKEGAYSLGATRFEVIRKISIPYARIGVLFAHLLSFGKVLGETLVVTLIIGNVNRIPSDVNGMGNTLGSLIFNRFDSANDLEFSSLFAIALLLFVITAVVNSSGRRLIRRIVL